MSIVCIRSITHASDATVKHNINFLIVPFNNFTHRKMRSVPDMLAIYSVVVDWLAGVQKSVTLVLCREVEKNKIVHLAYINCGGTMHGVK